MKVLRHHQEQRLITINTLEILQDKFKKTKRKEKRRKGTKMNRLLFSENVIHQIDTSRDRNFKFQFSKRNGIYLRTIS